MERASSVSSLERNEYSADVAYRYSITDAMYTVAAARASRFDYDNFGRDDWTYGLVLELVNRFTENFTATASIFYNKNDSDTFGSINEYEAWSGGVGLSAQWAF